MHISKKQKIKNTGNEFFYLPKNVDFGDFGIWEKTNDGLLLKEVNIKMRKFK